METFPFRIASIFHSSSVRLESQTTLESRASSTILSIYQVRAINIMERTTINKNNEIPLPRGSDPSSPCNISHITLSPGKQCTPSYKFIGYTRHPQKTPIHPFCTTVWVDCVTVFVLFALCSMVILSFHFCANFLPFVMLERY